jgi:hypothetical protein
MSNTIPTIASSAAEIEEYSAVLMPLASSEALGVDDDVAMVSNDKIIPTTVATKQRAANKSAIAPDTIIHRVARVFGAAIDAVPAL